MTPEGTAFIDAWFRAEDQKRKDRIDDRVAAGEDREFAVLRVMEEDFAARGPIVDELLAADPLMSPISAMTIAGDRLTAERGKQWVREGCPAEDALTFVGSYGRLEFAIWALDEGWLEPDVLYDMLPALWRGADPDDTNPRYLELWRDAWIRNGRRPVRDGAHLPAGKTLRCYRGQDADAPLGIAWSLNRKIAEKFARGAGTRQSNREGTVFETLVPRTAVLAYLTGRGESEVILPTLGSDYASSAS